MNTINLRSRMTTQDIDFFTEDATSQIHWIMHEAARYANRQSWRSGRRLI